MRVLIVKNILCVVAIFASIPVFSIEADTLLVKKHLTKITKTEGYRNHLNTKLLDQTAEYIFNVFDQYADTVFYQPYEVNGRMYRNVICRFGSTIKKPIMVLGAHYDVCGEQEGADDNASGVVGLLELARMLKGQELTRPLELVAYTLEEPPYFRTKYMGSNIHAQSLIDSQTEVYGMAAIEMIGYFSERKGSQHYPVKVMKVAYGTTGDFILLVKKSGHGDFVKNFSREFKNAKTIETSNLKVPFEIEGIDFSDHLNYWNAGFDALMVTNTAFFRNTNYHQKTDVMETLDIGRMAKVITAIFQAVVNIDNAPQSLMNKKFNKSKN